MLLTLAGKPVASVDDLTKHLKKAGEKPVPLKLLRGGKEMTIQVRPVYHVTLGRVDEAKKEFFIGVSVNSMDDALKSQLSLSSGQGIIVTEIVKDSPAEKAGVKANDIILEFGSQPIDSAEKLAAGVKANQDKSATLKVLRGGKPLDIAITPGTRDVKNDDDAAVRSGIRFLALQEYDRALMRNERTLKKTAEQLDREEQSSKQIQELREQVRFSPASGRKAQCDTQPDARCPA